LAPLIWAPKSQPQEAALMIPDPPPPLKGRKAGGGGGSGMAFSTVDPGALIWAVGEVRPQFRTPPFA
jgi:hypothetical protein